jgi:arabinose-5-phosphate isomerase
VRDVMRTGDNAPRVVDSVSTRDAMQEITRGRMGMTAIVDGGGRVVGIFTDGDLRRLVEKGADIRATPIAGVMSHAPRTIAPDKLAAEAVEIMERNKVNQVLVVDADHRLLGALNMHDLFRAKVI